MKLSILIPMYNAEAYISNCLDSLVNQDLETNDYEIIIMDDGSSDSSFKIVNEYVKTHTNISLYSENNVGSDTTRNKLLKLAKGDYIYFLDADDYIAYNSLGILIDYLVTYDLDFIGFETLKTTDLTIYQLNKKSFNTDFSQIQNGLEYIKNNRNLRHEVWWYIIKRSLVNDNHLVYDENGNNADVIFTLKLLIKANKLIYCSIPIHRYVQSNESVMRVKSLNQKKKLTDSMFSMIISYSKLINKIENETIEYKENIIDNLKFRRDVFAFFNIINMIQEKYSKNEIEKRLKQLKEVKAYPIKHFTQDHYKTLKYRFLNSLVNKKIILINVSLINNRFFK
jgi:glycosyltransferase involved in cell wall biosynthesis